MRRVLEQVREWSGVVALFVALGGTAYAAIELERNDVKSKHIRDGGVKTQDLKDSAVTSPKVANGSLLGEDFAAGQLPQGPQGEPGEPGQNGATKVVMREGPDTVIPGAAGYGAAEASCLPGERATGGGVFHANNFHVANMTASFPTPNPNVRPTTGNGQIPTGWRVWMNTPVNETVNAYVVCASP